MFIKATDGYRAIAMISQIVASEKLDKCMIILSFGVKSVIRRYPYKTNIK